MKKQSTWGTKRKQSVSIFWRRVLSLLISVGLSICFIPQYAMASEEDDLFNSDNYIGTSDGKDYYFKPGDNGFEWGWQESSGGGTNDYNPSGSGSGSSGSGRGATHGEVTIDMKLHRMWMT